MLDIRFIRENQKLVKANIKKKFQDEKIVDTLLDKDKKYRKLLQDSEKLRAERNQITNEINDLKLQALPAQLQMNLLQQQAELSRSQTMAKYAPYEAEARIDQIRTSIRATEQGLAEDIEKQTLEREKEEAAKPPTPTQYARYNEIVSRIFEPKFRETPMTPTEALRHIGGMGKELYTELIGENLYNQLVEELQEKATAEPEEITIDEKIATIAGDLNILTPEDAYKELLDNSSEYIRDVGVVEYRKLLKDYKDRLPEETEAEKQARILKEQGIE